ncbi:MAG: TetR/AcrR family transcriptional regulator [Janthinobacterium lividum]
MTSSVPAAAPGRARGRPSHAQAPVASDAVLLTRAFDLFAERGFEGAAVRDIARQLGISHTLLRHRFGSKEAIWVQAVDARIEQNAAALKSIFAESGLGAEERLSQLIRGFCRRTIADPALIRMLSTETRHDSKRLDHLVETFVRPFEIDLAPLLRAVAADPERPLDSLVFMSLLVNGAGTYFSASAMMRRVDPRYAALIGSRIDDFERVLMAAARNGGGWEAPTARG